MFKQIAIIGLITLVSACSDEQHPVDGDHVWKEQTDMIEKAKDVEQLIDDAALQQRQHIEQATD